MHACSTCPILACRVCVFNDGTRLECQTIRQITEKLGWFANPSRSEYDLAIYGAGPVGLSAAMYGASEGLRTVLVERWALGGQAGSRSKIENYLGFPDGIGGWELAERARAQAMKFGSEILLARAGMRAEFPPGKGIVYLEDGTRITARTSICATGVAYRKLGLADEERFFGSGLYYGAGTSEAALMHGEDVYVVGGGNSAGQAAMYFAQPANRACMVVRDASLKRTLSQYLVDRVNSAPNIEVKTCTHVTALAGDETLREATLADVRTGQHRNVKTHWLFVCIGAVPQTEWAAQVGTGWKRRSSAESFSMYFWYSLSVVAPTRCSSPRASAGLTTFDVLMPGPAQRHDEVRGLVDLAGVHIGERRTGTEVGSGRPRRA